VQIAAELSPDPVDFGPRALPSNRSLTALAARYAENTRWGVNGVYEIDVTEPVRAVLARFGHPSAIRADRGGAGNTLGPQVLRDRRRAAEPQADVRGSSGAAAVAGRVDRARRAIRGHAGSRASAAAM
jgi:hypothetical protein